MIDKEILLTLQFQIEMRHYIGHLLGVKSHPLTCEPLKNNSLNEFS